MQPQQPEFQPVNPSQQTNPQAMFQPAVQATPVTAQAVPGIVTPGMQQGSPVQAVAGSGMPKKRPKLPFIIAGVAVLLLVGLTVAALALGGKKTTPKAATTDQTANAASSGPAAATSSTMQQNYDAVSQSLSGLDDNSDFPANALDDTSLAKN